MPDETIKEIEGLAGETDLSIRKINKVKRTFKETPDEESRDVVGHVVKEVRSEKSPGVAPIKWTMRGFHAATGERGPSARE